jgi:hypothetical protein
MAGLPMTPFWVLPGSIPLRGPCWREIVETLPIGMAGCHLAVHLLFLRLLLISRVSRWVVYTLPRWKTIAEDSPTTFSGAKPGSSGTVSKRLPRYADMSRSASAWKSPWCADGKSPARKLLCGAECVMDAKWSDADGWAQVRFHSGGASADDVSLCSKKTHGARPQNNTRDHAREFTFGCFMRPLSERVAGSPRTPCPTVTLTKLEIKAQCHDLYVAACSINCSNSARERLLIGHRFPGAQDRLRRTFHRPLQAGS